ncbi:MAG: TlpA family protein disulfide reductase [Alphaproteobacteria bacterium]|nr:TlpA family protein disulfide reductase [Alphaproteobacteria bacterium]
MKGVLFAGFAAVAVSGSAIPAVNADSGPPIEGQVQNYEPLPTPVEAPDVTVLTKDGGETTLDRFEGKFVVLNFWATWCGPCIRELPSLDRLNAALPDDKAQVVLISQDRGGFKQTERFLNKLKVNFPDNFIDDRLKFSRAIGVVSLPTTILIGSDGKEVGRLVGHAEWDSEEALALVNWYLDRDQAAIEKSGS